MSSRGKKTDKGLLERIREYSGPSDPDQKPPIKKLLRQMSRQLSQVRPRAIWVGVKGLKSFHRGLGDDGFYDMIHNMEITTTTDGIDYIEQFLQTYEQDKEDNR